MQKKCKQCGINERYRPPSRKKYTFSYCLKCMNARHLAWYEENRERIRAKSTLDHWNRKSDVIKMYGGKCTCCGESDIHFLCIDHTTGGGSKHRKEMRLVGMTSIYRWLKKHGFPREGFQVLCYNCNMAKSLYKICPHKE